MNNHLRNCKKERVEYYTPKWVWECVKPYIPKNKVIWEAFRNENEGSCKSAKYLRELGFEVVNPLCNFFENDMGQICISNPPFNLKRQVLERLFKLNKPFMLLLPQIILNTIYFADMCKKDKDIQIIILPKRVDFITDKGDKKQVIHTLIICWKMNLKERIIFV